MRCALICSRFFRASLNRGETSTLISALPSSLAALRPEVPLKNSTELQGYWVAGFTAGDGCFQVNIRRSRLTKSGSPIAMLKI